MLSFLFREEIIYLTNFLSFMSRVSLGLHFNEAFISPSKSNAWGCGILEDFLDLTQGLVIGIGISSVSTRHINIQNI